MEKNQERFHYTYSAQQQEEIKNIRKKYMAPEEDKMEQLRRLHSIPTQKAQSASIFKFPFAFKFKLVLKAAYPLANKKVTANIETITNILLFFSSFLLNLPCLLRILVTSLSLT